MIEEVKNIVQPIKIALIAVGGDGGGVLTQWIVKLAAKNGYWSQSTTIAGVAQRTGSTVYYLELFPEDSIPEVDGKKMSPVLAQMPAPEDVDVVMTTELIEAGRAIQRGFVSKKTTLIFSTHRNLSIQEKEMPGDGILDGSSIFDLARKYAGTSVYANLKEIADNNKSVISATLFGALAASQALPFSIAQFEKTIEEGGVAVSTSLAAFKAACGIVGLTVATRDVKPYIPELKKAGFLRMPDEVSNKKLNGLIQFIRHNFPVECYDVLYAGVLHLVEWQDEKWALKYLEYVKPMVDIDVKCPEKEYELTKRVAQYLALGMAYDDLVNVADVKTRSERWETVFKQVGAKQGEIVKTTDYFHPRFEEVFGFMPVWIGKKLERSEKAAKWFTKYLDRDRRMDTHNLFWFLALYTLGGMKGYRLKTLRHSEEVENFMGWLQRVEDLAKQNYGLAVELAKTYRLKKGYGDTYARGHSKFTIMNEFILQYQNTEGIVTKVAELIDYALKNHELCLLKSKVDEVCHELDEANRVTFH